MGQGEKNGKNLREWGQLIMVKVRVSVIFVSVVISPIPP
jgi:hypothetical protein